MPYIPPMPDEPLVVRVFDRCMRGWLIPWWHLSLGIRDIYRHYRPLDELDCNCPVDDYDDGTAFCWECMKVRSMEELEPVYTWLKLCHKWGLETRYRCRDREFCASEEEADHG